MRAFSWHDLLSLYRYRNKVLTLDSTRGLTVGNPIGPVAMLSYLNLSKGSFVGVARSENNGDTAKIIGQIIHRQDESFTRLTFLTPEDACASSAFFQLIDGLAKQAGEWGSYQLLAEIDENAPNLIALRRAGFSVYARQRIWRMDVMEEKNDENHNQIWKPVTAQDEINVRNLYHTLVPPLVQRAEPLPDRPLSGLVSRQGGEIVAYVDGNFGPNGIYLYPLVHPGVADAADLITSLPDCYAPLMGRPIYLAIRSYHAWLESTLVDTGAQLLHRQALLVRYLTKAQRFPLIATNRLNTLDTSQTETTAPLIPQYKYNNDN